MPHQSGPSPRNVTPDKPNLRSRLVKLAACVIRGKRNERDVAAALT